MAKDSEKKIKCGRLTDPKHNILAFMDEKDKQMAVYLEIAAFFRRSRIFKAITMSCNAYESIVNAFWENAKLDGKEIKSTIKDKHIVISEEVIRQVLEIDDKSEDPVELEERLVKGCFLRMGYNAALNEKSYLKTGLSPPFKYLAHVVVHCLSHRKGGYDELLDYVMSAISALCLNLPFNFSKMIYDNMVINLTDGRWWMYPRFVQLIVNNQQPELKKEGGIIKQEHMNSYSCSMLKSYRGMEKDKIPKFRKLFGHLINEQYVAPTNNNWRKEDSDSDGEKARENGVMNSFVPTRSAKHRYIKIESGSEKEDDTQTKGKKRKRTPKVKIETPVVTASEPEKVVPEKLDSEEIESESEKLEYDREKSRYILKKMEKVTVDPDDVDESYVPKKDVPKKNEMKKKSKGRKKRMAKRLKSPDLIDESIDSMDQDVNVEGEAEQDVVITLVSFINQMMEDVTKGAVDLSKNDDVLKTLTAQATPKSQLQKHLKSKTQAKSQSQKESHSSLGLRDMFAIKKEFDELKAIVQEHTVTIESLSVENDRLRKKNAEMQRLFEESEARRIAQAKLLNQHRKYFMVLEKKLNLNLAKESEDLDVQLFEKFDLEVGTPEELIFKANLDKDLAEQDAG